MSLKQRIGSCFPATSIADVKWENWTDAQWNLLSRKDKRRIFQLKFESKIRCLVDWGLFQNTDLDIQWHRLSTIDHLEQCLMPWYVRSEANGQFTKVEYNDAGAEPLPLAQTHDGTGFSPQMNALHDDAQ